MGNIGMFGVRYKIEKKTYMDGRVEYCAFVDYSELSGKARVGAVFGTEKEARNWISEIKKKEESITIKEVETIYVE